MSLTRTVLQKGNNWRNLYHKCQNVPASPLRETRNICISATRFETFNVQDTADFKERVLNSNVPVIVDFHATWCNPCRTLGPRLESVIEEEEGKVHLAKVDIDENTDLAMEYGVSSVPVVMAVSNGKVTGKFVGLQDKDKLRSFIKQIANS